MIVYSWELSQGVRAELRFTGGEVGLDHLMLLKRYLDIHLEAIELGTIRTKIRTSIAEVESEKEGGLGKEKRKISPRL